MKTGFLCLISLFLLISFPLKSSSGNEIASNSSTKQKSKCVIPLPPPDKGYAEITKRVDGGYIQIYTGQNLKFNYVSEYNPGPSSILNTLKYCIYNEDREVVLGFSEDNEFIIDGSPMFTVRYGNNFIDLDCNKLGYKKYLLEVVTPKGDKLYLKFKRIESTPT